MNRKATENKKSITAAEPSASASTSLSDSPADRPGAAGRDSAIADFLDRFADCPDRDILADLLVAVTRLARDRAGRGELKMLTTSFKELRYAFKVFGTTPKRS